jgi:hypothetical protein
MHLGTRARKPLPAAHLPDMTNNTITKPITSWTELWATDREILNRTEWHSFWGSIRALSTLQSKRARSQGFGSAAEG